MLEVFDLGTLAYRPAWDYQLQVLERVLAGELPEGAIILVEHPPVITLGRRQDAMKNLLASSTMLQTRGVEVVESDRGGDITFHGPGQLVAYPIIPLNRYRLNLHSYMRLMEEAVIETVGAFGIGAGRLEGATGVWIDPAGVGGGKCCDPATVRMEKICAMGIKVRKWITLHGLALNVTTDLAFFDLINPCGLGRPVTSMKKILGEGCPGMGEVKGKLAERFGELLVAQGSHVVGR